MQDRRKRNRPQSIKMLSGIINRTLLKNIVVILLTAMFFSCAKKIAEVKGLYKQNESIPLSETKNFSLTYSLAGNRVLFLTAPLMLDYSHQKKFPYQYFPKKIRIVVLNKDRNEKTVITADKAYLYKNPDLSELMGHVNITGHDGSSLQTGHLFWDVANQHIFGDEKTVLRQNDEQITGTGFDSSLDFKNVRLNQIQGVLKIKNNSQK